MRKVQVTCLLLIVFSITLIANCCQPDDNQNCMLLIWKLCVLSFVIKLFLFSTARNKIVEKGTSSLKRDGFLLTQVVPLCFCLYFQAVNKRDEGSGVQVPGDG